MQAVEERLPAATMGNRLVDALPPEESAWLWSRATRTYLHRGATLVARGARSDFLYFPIDALVAVWNHAEARTLVAHLAGRFGVAPLERTLSCEYEAAASVTALAPGYALRLPYEAFEERAQDAEHPLRRLINRFACAVLHSAAIRMACNAEHGVKQRVARWLLLLGDAGGTEVVNTTHEVLASLSLIRRPSVSLAISSLTRDGAVAAGHGRIVILDRSVLEREACSCALSLRRVLRGATEPIVCA
jgi:CRP-like cAMP-binding protein